MMAAAAAGLTIRAYAEHRKSRGLPGGNPSAVQKALKSGRITRSKNGKIDPEAADRAWSANTDPAKQRIAAPAPAAPGQVPVASPMSDSGDYQDWKRRREAAAARKAEMELAREAGKLGEVKAMREEAFRLGRRLRDLLLPIPDRLDAMVAAETDARTCNQLIRDELLSVLELLVADERD